MNYFDKLPTITYDGKLAKNLLVRAKLDDKTKNNKFVFYPYTMEPYDRADTVANLYYDNPGYTWLMWYANDIVDPFYDMPLNDEEFYYFIVSKYGSEETARRKIKHYALNWYDDSDKITLEAYEALSNNYKKYWDPVVNNQYEPYQYKRRNDNHILATNKVQILNLSSVSGTFTIGEEIRVNVSNYAFVTAVTSTTVICQHVTGAFANTNTITGQTSGAAATIDSITTVSESLAATDPLYWTATSFYDYEYDKNEAKRDIKLIDVRLAGQAEDELRRNMRL